MNQVDAPMSAKEIIEQIDIADSTLRKWCLALEEQNYNFVRTAQNKRMFSEKDLFVLSQFKVLVQTKNLSISNAAEIIASKYSGDVLLPNETEVEQAAALVENNPFLLETLKELKTEMELLKDMNRLLLAKLDEQQKYIDERLSKRDQMLMESLKTSQETKMLLLAAKEEQKKKKGIFSFFSKD